MTVTGTPLTPDRLEKIYQILSETLPRHTGDLGGLLKDLWALSTVPPGLSKIPLGSSTENEDRMIPLIQAIAKQRAGSMASTIPRHPLLTREMSTTDALQRTRMDYCAVLPCRSSKCTTEKYIEKLGYVS